MSEFDVANMVFLFERRNAMAQIVIGCLQAGDLRSNRLDFVKCDRELAERSDKRHYSPIE